MSNLAIALSEVRSQQIALTKERIMQLELDRLSDMGLFGDAPQFKAAYNTRAYRSAADQHEDNTEAGARLRNPSIA